MSFGQIGIPFNGLAGGRDRIRRSPQGAVGEPEFVPADGILGGDRGRSLRSATASPCCPDRRERCRVSAVRGQTLGSALVCGYQMAFVGTVVSQALKVASANWGDTSPIEMYKNRGSRNLLPQRRMPRLVSLVQWSRLQPLPGAD